jgi:fumarate reductase subunit C
VTTFDFSAITTDQIVWFFVICFALLIVLAAIRFFFQHILKFLIHIMVVILAIIGLLVVLHYLGVF